MKTQCAKKEIIVKQLFDEMKIDKCKTSSSRGLTNQPLALGRVFVVVVAVVVFVAFLAGSCSVRYVSCDEAGAGETDISDMAVRGPTPDIVRLLG